LSDFDLAEGNTDAGGRLSIDGTVRIPDLVMAPIAAPRVRSAIATTTAAVAHLVDARAPYWLAPRHTASSFSLRWWITNLTVFAYMGSRRSQGRIAAGERLQHVSSYIFKPNGLHWLDKVS
jgi:hypothetical protein